MSGPVDGGDVFVPTIEAARDAGLEASARVWWRMGASIDLFSEEPVDARRVAAILVDAEVFRRETREVEIELAAHHASRIPEPIPDVPETWTESHARALLEIVRRPARCSRCHEGKVLCAVCGGSRFFMVQRGNDTVRVPCQACRAVGTLACATCEGTSATIVARALLVDDVIESLRYPYVPEMPFALEEALTRVLEEELSGDIPQPDALRVTLEPERSGGPYRQAVREPTFRGFDYADALEQARRAISALRGASPIDTEIKIWARPILWLRHRAWGVRREVAVFRRASRRIDVIVTDGGL